MTHVVNCIIIRKKVFNTTFNGFIQWDVSEEVFYVKACHDIVSRKINNFLSKQE